MENGVEGRFEDGVSVPPTVEDLSVVDVARGRVRRFFEEMEMEKRREEGVKAKL